MTEGRKGPGRKLKGRKARCGKIVIPWVGCHGRKEGGKGREGGRRRNKKRWNAGSEILSHKERQNENIYEGKGRKEGRKEGIKEGRKEGAKEEHKEGRGRGEGRTQEWE